jgi:hypothetical protein
MAGIDVSALADFNNQLAGKIVLDTVFTGTTGEYVSIQEGIKYQEPLNLAVVTPTFQGGDAVSTPLGSAVFSQRNITVTKRTAYDNWNLQLLTDKYLGKMALPAGSYEETFAIMEQLTGDLVRKAQQANDYFVWQSVSGSATSATDTAVAEADGFVGLISGSTSGVNVPTGAGATPITGSTAYAQLVDMIDVADSNIVSADDLTFFCGPQVFTKIVSGLTTQNLFHFDPTTVERRNGIYEVPLPGFPNIKIVGTWGLNGSQRIVLGPASDMVIGTDLQNDTESFKTWYSIDDDSIKYRLRNKLGVQIGHPNYFVSNDLA